MGWSGAICGIYGIYNDVTGEFYIGKAVDIFKRKVEHFKALERNTHYNTFIQNSFNKYGGENFRFTIIEECSKEQLDNLEKYYIECYDSFNSGFNLTTGGDGVCGRKWNENQYKVMKEVMKGNQYGKGNSSHTGLTLSQETKDKIRNSLLGRKRGKYKTKKHDRQGISQ